MGAAAATHHKMGIDVRHIRLQLTFERFMLYVYALSYHLLFHVYHSNACIISYNVATTTTRTNEAARQGVHAEGRNPERRGHEATKIEESKDACCEIQLKRTSVRCVDNVIRNRPVSRQAARSGRGSEGKQAAGTPEGHLPAKTEGLGAPGKVCEDV